MSRLSLAVLFAGPALAACTSGERSEGTPARSPAVVVVAQSSSLTAAEPAGTAPAVTDCGERVDAALLAVEAAVARARGPCAHAADCEAAGFEIGCQGTCPAPVLRSRVQALLADVKAIDGASCEGFRERCPDRWATPRCLFGPVVCRDSTCSFDLPVPSPP